MTPFIVAAAVAVLSWAIAKEEVVGEFREWCEKASKDDQASLWWRKLCYLPTCEYCTSAWVTLVALLIFQYRVEYEDWRGYLLAHLFTWALAVGYMAVFQRLRVDIHQGQVDPKKNEKELDK